MGHRSLALLTGALVSLLAQGASALGLGEINLQSTLNQPLQAEIKLLEVRDLTQREIIVNLASREDFDRVGVDKVYFLTDLKFKVDLKAPGGPVVHIQSSKPVREPYLNFVVEAHWPSGRLLREYTLLMDLPVFGNEPMPAVQTTTAQTASTVAPQASAPSAAPSTSTSTSDYNPRSKFTPEGGQQARPQAARTTQSGQPAQSYAPAITADAYEVRANDTLWEIAAQVRPDRSVSIQQTMLAIQRNNPDAFINNNINLLKKGQILRIPDRGELEVYSSQRAVAEVAKQNASWKRGYGDEEVSDAALVGSSSYSEGGSRDSVREGRVKLAAPDDVYGSAEGRTSGSAAEVSTEALENELAITHELLDKSTRENSDLRSTVQSLEEQINTLERMLEVSSEDMRALELAAEKTKLEREAAEANAALAAADGGAELPADTAADEQPAAEQSPLSAAGEDLALGDAETEAGPSEAVAQVEPQPVETGAAEAPAIAATETPKPIDRAKTVVSAPVPEPSLIDMVMENILYVALALAALIGGLVYLQRRRAAAEDEDFDDFLEQAESGIDDEAGEPGEEGEDEFDLGDFDEQEDAHVADDQDEADEEEVELEAQTEDVVAEADIYIAYGKYDQAEEMLLKALRREPGDEDIRLKLLEVYAAQGDAERFDPHYAKLRVFASPDAVERGEHLRNGIEGAAEFDESSFDTSDVSAFAAPVADESDDTETSLDLSELEAQLGSAEEQGDDSLEEFAATFAGEGDDDTTAFDLDLGDLDSDGELDLELDLDMGDEAPEQSASADIKFDESSESDFDLDGLDLDLGEADSDTTLDFEADEDETEQSDATALDLDTDLDLALPEAEIEAAEPQDDSFSLGDELESMDFDLDLDLDSDSKPASAPADESLETDIASLDADLDLTLEDAYLEQEEEAEDEFNLGDMNDLDADLDIGGELEPLAGAAAPAELAGEAAAEVPSDDDLTLTTEVDISSLDQELDALTGDVAEPAAPAAPAKMDEPVTDFDDFETELEADADLSAAEREADRAAAEEIEGMGEETMFDKAVADVPESDVEFELPEMDPEAMDDDSDLDFLSDSDEVATKLDLARAYIDMGDQEGARDIIREVMKEGNEQQRQEAEGLMSRIDA